MEIKVNSRNFAVMGHRFFRKGVDKLLKRFVSKVEVHCILAICHDNT